MTDQTRDFFDTLAKVLIRAWLAGAVLLGISAVAVIFAGDMIDNLHGSWFGLNPHELDLMIYGYLGIHKLLINTLFLFPWIAIRLVLGSSKTHTG